MTNVLAYSDLRLYALDQGSMPTLQFQVPVIVPAMKTLRYVPSGVGILWPFVAILHQDMGPILNLGSCSHPYSPSYHDHQKR